MDDALVVRAREPLGDLGGEVQRARLAPAAPRASASLSFSPRISSIAMNVTPVGFADLVDHGDVGVLERGGGARLLEEALAARPDRSARSSGRTLSATSRAEVDVQRAIDDAHAAAADLFDDLVVRKPPAGQCHCCGVYAGGGFACAGGARAAVGDRDSIGASLCADVALVGR